MFSQSLKSIVPTFCYFVLSSLAIVGCNSGPELIPISGQVKIDGKPLELGTVTVWVKDYRPAYGAIGPDGRFALRTHKPGDGCRPGTHRVTVSSETAGKGDVMKYFAPKRYKEPDQSGLEIQVEQPRDDWEINLTWAGDSHNGPYTEQ
jgi:hypothetical protein